MAERVTEKYLKKLLGIIDIEAELQRLDRLAMEGSKMIVETPDMLYGLSNTMQVVDGAYRLII